MNEQVANTILTAVLTISYHLYPSLHHLGVPINRKYSGIGRFRIMPMGKYEVEVAAMLSPLSVAGGRIGFGVRMGMVIDHLAIVGVDIVKNTHEVSLGN